MTSEMSPLFKLAIASGKIETVKSHLERGANVNARDNAGVTALLLAASRGRQEICAILLEHGADPDVTDGSGRTIHDYARQWGFEIAIQEMDVSGLGPQLDMASTESNVAAMDLLVPQQPSTGPEGPAADILPLVSTSQPATRAEQELSVRTSQLGFGIVQEVELSDGWEAEDHHDGWETDHESKAPQEDLVRAAAARSAHNEFSRANATVDTSNWSTIHLTLPKAVVEDVKDLPKQLEELVSQGLQFGRLPTSRVQSALKGLKAPEKYAAAVRTVIAELGIAVQSSFFEEVLDGNTSSELRSVDSERLAEAADLLDGLLGEDAEARYLAEVRTMRDEAASIQPILWARAEELRRRASSRFASMPQGLDLLEAAGALFAWEDDVSLEEESELALTDIENFDPDFTAGTTASNEEHLSSVFSGLSEVTVTERLIQMRLPVSVMVKAAKLADEAGTESANDLISMLDELAHHLDRVVETNLSLVTWLAGRYRNRGLDYLDLVQEGNIGLMKAVQKFDPSRGAKLATYAIWWIRQSMTRSISDLGRTIRLPVHLQERTRKLERVRIDLKAELGTTPEPSLTAARMEMSEEAVTRLEINVGTLMPESGDNVQTLARSVADRIPEAASGPEDLMWDNKVQQEIFDLLLELHPREERVIRLRFGIGLTDELTLEEVGETFDVTRERIRQIEAKALRRLSHPGRSKRLRGVLNVQ